MNQEAMAALMVFLPRLAQGLAENPWFIGFIATGIGRASCEKLEDRITSARETCEIAFKHLEFFGKESGDGRPRLEQI